MTRTSKFVLALVASASIVPGAAIAQNEGSASSQRESSQPEARRSSGFDGQVSLSGVLASAAVRDEDEFDSSALIARGEVGYQHDLGKSDLRFEYGSSLYMYKDDDRDERWSNRFTGVYGVNPGRDWRVAFLAEYATNLATTEAGSTDQTQIRATAEHSPGNHRIRGYAGWRWRTYDDALGSEGGGPLLGAEYRYRLGSYNSISTELRHEDISSDNPLRGFQRTTADVFYTHPLARRTRVEAGVTARWLSFDGRPSGGLGSESRNDRTITPEVELLHGGDTGPFGRARLEYIIRNSNDPDFDRNGRRATATIGWRF